MLAWDDTDSTEGGCSTQLLFEVLDGVPELRLRGMPRLVRLNPNVPFKTRGNAAVVVPLGSEMGPRVQVAESQGRPIHAWPDSPPAELKQEHFDAVADIVEAHAQPGSQCAIVWATDVPEAAYWAGVQTLVSKEAATSLLPGGFVRGPSRQGIVGCVAALAWPGPPTSFELIAVRERSRWGQPREVDPVPLQDLDEHTTFHSWDAQEGVSACIPRTPCPVLAGLRGLDPETLVGRGLDALQQASSEPIDSWAVWATNQASGDHVVEVDCLSNSPPAATVQLRLRIEEIPENLPGGHVRVPAADAQGVRLTLMAFEPTKGFRDVVRQLLPADLVVATGAYAQGTLRLEKLEVLDAAPRRVANPVASSGKAMKSAGAGQGFRDRATGERAPPEAGVIAPRDSLLGRYEVPVMARRHLHRPYAMSTN